MELFELLKDSEKSTELLRTIENHFRYIKKWGRRGFIKELADATGFSPAYVGQVFSGKKPLTEKFVSAVADYLGIGVAGLLTGNLMSMETCRTLLRTATRPPKVNNEIIAHATLDTLLNSNDANPELLNSILNIFKYLSLEDLIDIRYELLNLVDKNSKFFDLNPESCLSETEMMEKPISIKKLLNCSLTSRVSIMRVPSKD